MPNHPEQDRDGSAIAALRSAVVDDLTPQEIRQTHAIRFLWSLKHCDEKSPDVQEIIFEIIARHEAAHAVMQWLLGLKATAIRAAATDGHCAASHEITNVFNILLICLAGNAWDTGCGFIQFDLEKCHDTDFENARSLLKQFPILRSRDFDRVLRNEARKRDFPERYYTVEDALARHFATVCGLLRPATEIVERLGFQLEQEGTMSARQVEAFFRAQDLRSLSGRIDCAQKPSIKQGPQLQQTNGAGGSGLPHDGHASVSVRRASEAMVRLERSRRSAPKSRPRPGAARTVATVQSERKGGN
jgi:hypothetical protein